MKIREQTIIDLEVVEVLCNKEILLLTKHSEIVKYKLITKYPELK